MAVIKRLCNTLNRNANNSNNGRKSPQLTKCRKFSMTNYFEQDKIEVAFSNVHNEEVKKIRDLSDEFILIDVKHIPTLTPYNIEHALSRPYFNSSFCSRRFRTLSLPAKPFSEFQFWDSFLQSMSEMGVHCLKHNLLLVDDFIEQEPFLYIGLPAIVIFDMVHRSCSMKSYPIVFPNGTTLDSRHTPPNGPVPYKLLEILKFRFTDFKLSSTEIALIKIKLLYSSGEREFPLSMQSNIDDARLSLLNAFIADIISTSIDLTQFAYFKNNFETNVTQQILRSKF